MTNEELKKIRKQYHATNHSPSLFSYSQTIKYIPALIAEVERLQSTLELYRREAEL